MAGAGLSDIADLPLFADQSVAITDAPLPVMTTGEHVITDYQTAGLSLKSIRCDSCAGCLQPKVC